MSMLMLIVSASADCYKYTRDLTIGSTGSDVAALQEFLVGEGYTVPITGYFGSDTQSALASWQSANEVSPAVGYFGPITRYKIYVMCGSGIPEFVPFGGMAEVFGLATVSDISIRAYTYHLGEYVRLDSFSRGLFQGIEKIEDLDEELQNEDLHFTLSDPRERIYINAYLEDSGGNEIFSSNTQFYLTKSVRKGKVEYSYPKDALRLTWFFTETIKFKMDDVQSATAHSKYGNQNLTVRNGFLYLPAYVLNDSSFDTLEVRLNDGSVVWYDHTGHRLDPTKVEIEFGSSWVHGINQLGLDDGYLLYSRDFDKENNWNPTIEVTLDQDQYILLDISDTNNKYFRPEIGYYTTLEDLRGGETWEPFEYLGYQPWIFLKKGTYYFRFEWPRYSPFKG